MAIEHLLDFDDRLQTLETDFMQREFNIFGPVHPDYHYHVNRIAVKNELRKKINKRRYLSIED